MTYQISRLSIPLRKTATGLLLILLSYGSSVVAQPVVVPDPPQLAAKAWAMIDFDSGKLLAARNPDERIEPASITKVMTSYIVMREIKENRLNVNDSVFISQNAWKQEGSRSFVNVGTQVPVDILVKGMIIQSGNDSSVALAEKISGTEESFAAQMNAQAKKLGMNQTNFMNATGLPHPNHYTTANDIIKLAVAFIRDFPEEYKIYSQKEFVWNKIKQTNRNRLLWQDESVDGMKTGHTQSAGYCLVASAKRGDMRLMTVLLGADSEKARAQETQKLLNYGFRFYETHRLYDPTQELTQVRVWRGALDQVAVGTELPIYLTIPRGHYEQLKPIMEIKPNVTAPLKKGDMVGTLTVKLAGEIVASEKLVVKTDVPTGNLFKQGLDQIRLLIGMDK